MSVSLLVGRSFRRRGVRNMDFGHNSAVAPVFVVDSELILLDTCPLTIFFALTFCSRVSIARVLKKLRSLFLDLKT